MPDEQPEPTVFGRRIVGLVAMAHITIQGFATAPGSDADSQLSPLCELGAFLSRTPHSQLFVQLCLGRVSSEKPDRGKVMGRNRH